MILAMGAKHIPQDKLEKLIALINKGPTGVDRCQSIIETCYKYDPSFSQSYCNLSVYGLNDYVIEEKYDGYSYLNDNGRFFSKSLSQAKGNEGQPVEKTDHIPHLSDVLKKVAKEIEFDIHGEIYIEGGTSDSVTKILGCTSEEAIRRTQLDWNNRLRFKLIDIRSYRGHVIINEPYYVRRALLEHLYYRYIQPVNGNNDIQLAEILVGDPRIHFKRITENGGEGIMIKDTRCKYYPDKKPANNWIKVKKKVTHDVVIMGFNEGTGKNKDLFGSIEFGHYIDGKIIKCGNASSGLDDALRIQIAENPHKYIGTVMEIEAIQESIKSFRNAVFLRLRDDKHPTECTPINIRVKDII